MASLSTPWNSLTTTPVQAETASERKPTLQEIMDEEFARQLYEEECRAIEELVPVEMNENIFSDLEDKHTDRELLGADSFDDDSEKEMIGATRSVSVGSVATKAKQGFDRSRQVEGSQQGLNSIRESFRRREKDVRHGRVEKEKFATHDAVLDERTTWMLQKLINRGDLDEVHGCVQSGKEANVYFAVGTDPETFQKRQYAVKIFKTTLNSFSNRNEYITGDRRYDLAFQKKDRRRQIKEWSEKEFRNLSRAVKCIRVPEVIAVKEHIVVMSFIGDGSQGLSAPTLKEAGVSMTSKQLVHAYADVLQSTRELFQHAKLVHSDLSEYNVLYHKQKCWLIDFGQAVDQTHPQFLEFLHRDLANVRRFFERQGIPSTVDIDVDSMDGAGLLTNDEAFEWVTAVRDSDALRVLAPHPALHKLLRVKI